jgi:hypothetical protein
VNRRPLWFVCLFSRGGAGVKRRLRKEGRHMINRHSRNNTHAPILPPQVTHPAANSSTLKPTVGATSTARRLGGCDFEAGGRGVVCVACAPPPKVRELFLETDACVCARARARIHTFNRSIAVVLPPLSRPTTSTLTWAGEREGVASRCCSFVASQGVNRRARVPAA